MSGHPEGTIGRAVYEMANNDEESDMARDAAMQYLANWDTMGSTEKIDAIGHLRDIKQCSYDHGGWLK